MADVPTEKSLDDFFAKRDKKKKKEKGKGKEPAAGPTSAAVKKNKKEKEKSSKNENQDAQIEKVTLLLSGNFLALRRYFQTRASFRFCTPVTICFLFILLQLADGSLTFYPVMKTVNVNFDQKEKRWLAASIWFPPGSHSDRAQKWTQLALCAFLEALNAWAIKADHCLNIRCKHLRITYLLTYWPWPCACMGELSLPSLNRGFPC